MEIIAREESRLDLVLLRLKVFILFNVENDLSTDAVETGIVSTSLSYFTASETVCNRSFSDKNLRRSPGDLHLLLTACVLYNPMRSAFNLTKSKYFEYFDRLSSLVSSKCRDIP